MVPDMGCQQRNLFTNGQDNIVGHESTVHVGLTRSMWEYLRDSIVLVNTNREVHEQQSNEQYEQTTCSAISQHVGKNSFATFDDCTVKPC